LPSDRSKFIDASLVSELTIVGEDINDKQDLMGI